MKLFPKLAKHLMSVDKVLLNLDLLGQICNCMETRDVLRLFGVNKSLECITRDVTDFSLGNKLSKKYLSVNEFPDSDASTSF